MKRSPKGTSDIDMHGRVRRRAPSMVTSSRTIGVKLVGGPLDGHVREIPATAEILHIGPVGAPFFTYTFAGRLAAAAVLAIQPKSRWLRRQLFVLVGKMGRDPRIEAQAAKDQPIRNVLKESAHGRGARKRAAKRGTS